jgi:hypothetical protein
MFSSKKSLAMGKRSSLFAKRLNNLEKKFYNTENVSNKIIKKYFLKNKNNATALSLFTKKHLSDWQLVDMSIN